MTVSREHTTVLQTQSEENKMEVVNETNSHKCSGQALPKAEVKPLVYRVEEVAAMLAISLRAAYNLCNSTKEFKVLHIGNSIRVSKESFDEWFGRAT